jgi:hypothetical protein
LVLALSEGRARVVATARRFVAGDPAAAAGRAVAALAATPSVVYAPTTLRETLAAVPFRSLDERALAAAPLLAIRHAIATRQRAALVLTTDPSGQAGAALIHAT